MSQDLLNIYWLLESCQHSKVLVCVTMFESQESYIVELRQQIFKAVDDEVVKYMLFVKRRMLSLYFSLMPIIFPKKGGRQCCLERIWICFSRQFWGSFRQFVGCWQMLVCWPLASWHILTGGHFVSRLSPIYFALPPNGWGHPHIGEKKYIWQVWFGKVWWKEMLVGSWKKFRWYSFVSMWSIMV